MFINKFRHKIRVIDVIRHLKQVCKRNQLTALGETTAIGHYSRIRNWLIFLYAYEKKIKMTKCILKTELVMRNANLSWYQFIQLLTQSKSTVRSERAKH